MRCGAHFGQARIPIDRCVSSESDFNLLNHRFEPLPQVYPSSGICAEIFKNSIKFSLEYFFLKTEDFKVDMQELSLPFTSAGVRDVFQCSSTLKLWDTRDQERFEKETSFG